MKVLVIGYGSIGSVLTELLAKEKEVKSITCGVRRIKKHIKNKKVKFVMLDASKSKDIIKHTKNVDIAINTSLPDFNTTIMEACLSTNTHYIDLASYWEVDSIKDSKNLYKVEQLKFDKEFKKKKLIGLINAGASPGISNLLAAKAVDHLDSTESIKIRLIEDVKSEGLYFPWSIKVLLDQFNSQPIIYENGKYKKKERFSGIENYYFPKLGKHRVGLISQEEVATIPFFLKVKNVDLKASDSAMTLGKTLYNLGLISQEPIKIKGVEIAPQEFLAEAIKKTQSKKPKGIVKEAVLGVVVEAKGKLKGKNVIARYNVIFPSERKIKKILPKANYVSYPTAMLTKMFALCIPKIIKCGVFPPEALNKAIRDDILRNLKEKGIVVNEQHI